MSNQRRHFAVDEVTPLLAASGAGSTLQPNEETIVPRPTSEHEDDDDENRPLPIQQILLLCYARLVEPIAFFSIFPFINQMIKETGGVEEADVGFYSGMIVGFYFMPLRFFNFAMRIP